MAGSFQKRHHVQVHKLGFQKKLQYRLVEVTLGGVTNPKSDLNIKSNNRQASKLKESEGFMLHTKRIFFQVEHCNNVNMKRHVHLYSLQQTWSLILSSKTDVHHKRKLKAKEDLFSWLCQLGAYLWKFQWPIQQYRSQQLTVQQPGLKGSCKYNYLSHNKRQARRKQNLKSSCH